jgi:hypothetical protein
LILPEIAQLTLSSDSEGVPLSMRLLKQGDIPVRIAAPGEVPVGTIIPRDVNVWDKYNMSRDNLATKLGVTGPKTHALIYELKLQEEKECYFTWTHKGARHAGYSKKALERLEAAVPTVDLKEVWDRHKHRFGAAKKKAAIAGRDA